MSRQVGRRKAATAALLGALVAGMAALSFAAVPLYRAFCQATGFGGTTQRAEAAPGMAAGAAAGAAAGRLITVRFDSNVDGDLPWRFEPAQGPVAAKVGEATTVFFRATNLSRQAVVGQAAFNVTPLKAGLYFDKVQCFCFSEQRLAAGESADMAVTFFVNPDMLTDRNLDDVNTITLSYTFYRDRDAEKAESRAAGGGAGTAAAPPPRLD